MPEKKLNVGVIGCGAISAAHFDAYKNYSRANLHSVCDNDAAWLPEAAKLHRVKNAYTDYREMLADPKLDAVSVCLPTALHTEAAVAALKAGKHVLCEKPMALNAADALKMKKAADASGKKLMVSHNQRFEESVQLIKKHADEGFFGDIYMMRIGWRRPMGILPEPMAARPNGMKYNRNFFNDKDNGGGVLRDLGSHLLDLSLYITNFPKPVDVNAGLYRKFYPDSYEPGKFRCDSEDMAVAQIRFDTGLTMQLEVSFGSYVKEDVVLTEVYGTKGGASRRGGTLDFIGFDGSHMVSTRMIGYYYTSKCSQHRFVDAVLDDTPVPVPPDEGVKVIELLDAIYKAGGEIK